MKQRFLSIFTVVALMASVLAGAMGVSLRYAKADSVDNTEYAVFSEIWEEITSIPYISSNYSSSQLQNFYDYVNPKVADIEENSNYVVMVMHDDNTNKWSINLYQFYNFNYISSFAMLYMEYENGIGYPDRTNGEVWLRAWFYYDGNVTASIGTNVNNLGLKNWARSTTYSYNNYMGYLTTQDQAVPGRLCYSSKDIVQGDQGTWSCTKNLLYDHPTPPMIYFDLGVFWLGSRQYLSILQQDIMRDLDPEHLNEASLIVYLYNSGEGDYKEFTYSDVTLLPGDWQYFVNLNFTNVSPAGLYVIDITGNEWDIITGGEIVHFDEDYVTYAISDSRIEMNQGVPGTDGTPDSYTQVFNYFTEYANNYNRTHYIPENLADTLFGLNGSRLYPCEVSVPVAVWNANTSAGSSFADSHNWKWWFPSRDNYGINFELMDVVIVTEPYNDRYSLLYYYSDSLNVPFQFIQNMTFDELLEEFDCIIIVPDDLNMLDGNVWWKNLLTDICTFLGISDLTSNLLTSLAMSGSDSNGVEYVSDRPDEVPGTLQGFCIVTKKAIQRQQLYVFNEGITKTYELMSNYLDERGKWEDSFFEWTLSLFYQWQTLDGKLGDIYNLLYGWNLSSVLSDISESLARIANNTSEEDPGYWFLSLFNWLNRFSVTDSDFANWVSEYDDFTDDLPDPGTGATVIPFPTAIPTVAVGG